jgi:hypothetical protein
MSSMMGDDEEWSLITATVAAGVMIATPLSLDRTTSGGSESDGVLVDLTPLSSPKKAPATPAPSKTAAPATTTGMSLLLSCLFSVSLLTISVDDV